MNSSTHPKRRMGKQITEWIYEGDSFRPGQVMEKKDALNHEWDFWEFRPSRRPIRNKDWIESEQKRIMNKGLKVEIRRRLIGKGSEIALFQE